MHIEQVEKSVEMTNEVSRLAKGTNGKGRVGISVYFLILITEIFSYTIFSQSWAEPIESIRGRVFFIASGDVAGLINAIKTANSNRQENKIKLAAGTYTLTAVENTTDGDNGLPSIASNVTIQGTSVDTTIIERDPNAPAFRIFHVAPTGTLNLNGLTVKGGFIECCDIGGAIFNDGLLTITSSTISDNSAVFEGGGIAGNGRVTITNSTISFNSAQDGGGIFNKGPVTITSSTISDNSGDGFGGGIWGGVPLTIIDSGIFHNSINFFGGGIATAQMRITNSIIFNNSSGFIGGGIAIFEGLNPSTSTITKSTISNNAADSFGDGIYNDADNTLTIIDTAISDNTSSDSIDNNGGVINIINTTISNNVIAIENDSNGTVSIVNSTIANNTFGISNPNDEFNDTDRVKLQNTILANNTRNGIGFDCSGSVTSLGNNIIGDTTACSIALQKNDLTGDPGLDTFEDNGIPGNGHFPLLPNSRAIDAGNNALCLSNPILFTDQIGQPRNDFQGRHSIALQQLICSKMKPSIIKQLFCQQNICDIGSIEFQKHRNQQDPQR